MAESAGARPESAVEMPGPAGAVFVDTNVFLRYLTDDVPEQAAAAERLFRRGANGDVQLVTSAMVMTELVWVMESYYRLSKPGTQQRALAVATMEGLHLPGADLVIQALFDYVERNVDFIDAYNAAWAHYHGVDSIATFDAAHFGRLPHVRVFVPGDP